MKQGNITINSVIHRTAAIIIIGLVRRSFNEGGIIIIGHAP